MFLLAFYNAAATTALQYLSPYFSLATQIPRLINGLYQKYIRTFWKMNMQILTDISAETQNFSSVLTALHSILCQLVK
jgi:hypothetical protein